MGTLTCQAQEIDPNIDARITPHNIKGRATTARWQGEDLSVPFLSIRISVESNAVITLYYYHFFSERAQFNFRQSMCPHGTMTSSLHQLIALNV
jgi:hypothetical protein